MSNSHINMQKSSLVLFCITIILLVTVQISLSADTPHKIRNLYSKGEVSPFALENVGKEISVSGFMAPPLLPKLDFFILTKMPLAVCPFCEPEMEWPDYLVFVRMKKTITPMNYRVPIVVTGRLEIGAKIDKETGFFSKVRLINATYEVSQK